MDTRMIVALACGGVPLAIVATALAHTIQFDPLPSTNQASTEPRLPVIVDNWGDIHEYRCTERSTHELDVWGQDAEDQSYGRKSYGGGPATRLHWDNWMCRDNDCQETQPGNIARSQFRLYYHREPDVGLNKYANGGRCETQPKALLTNDGWLSTRFYVHSNVKTSTGVFTIGLFPGDDSAHHEVNLAVINLYQNGEKRVKFGQPDNSVGLTLDNFDTRWVTVRVRLTTRHDSDGNTHDCLFSVSTEYSLGAIRDEWQLPARCSMPTLEQGGKIVITSRARDDIEGETLTDDRAFVTVDYVKFLRMHLLE